MSRESFRNLRVAGTEGSRASIFITAELDGHPITIRFDDAARTRLASSSASAAEFEKALAEQLGLVIAAVRKLLDKGYGIETPQGTELLVTALDL